jgi:hypothetical protein
MTVSTIDLPDFSRDALLTAAIRVTGTLSLDLDPEPRQLAQAATHLNLVLDTMQASGIILRTVERTTLALTAGVSEYDLDTSAIDIEIGQSDTIGTIIMAGGSEPIVKAMSRQEWLELSNKTYAGMPTRAYLEKKNPLHLVFWPVPNSAATFRYTKVRLLKSAGNGANTIDLMRSWSQYLVYAVGANVALDNSLFDRSQQLLAYAEKVRPKAEANESQHGRIRFRIGNSGRNW